MEKKIRAKVFAAGRGVSAYQIISQARWTACGTDPKELGKWAFEPLIPEISNVPNGFKSMGYGIVAAGTDFGGGGKSNDHPVLALKGAGIKVLVAESFNRIFFRNALNLGVPAVTCPGILEAVRSGQELECNICTGEITCIDTGRILKGSPLQGRPMELIEAGGLLAHCQTVLQKGNGNF